MGSTIGFLVAIYLVITIEEWLFDLSKLPRLLLGAPFRIVVVSAAMIFFIVIATTTKPAIASN